MGGPRRSALPGRGAGACLVQKTMKSLTQRLVSNGPHAANRPGVAVTCALACGTVMFLFAWFFLSSNGTPSSMVRKKATAITELLQTPGPVDLDGLSIVRLNLLCAQGLAPTDESDSEALKMQLRSWAERVRSETRRHWYRYQRDPREYENSEGFFRMLVLTVVLAEDFHVSYDAARQAGPGRAGAGDGFFRDPEAVFVHGLLGPKRKGTCSSLPVLYVAIGRELGYPLKLVTTKGHLFVRWEGNGERFNVEATSRGLSRFEDDYYRHWPFKVSAAEEEAEGYLKSLGPPGELAVFLSIRGMCLEEQGRVSEAAQAFAAAARFAPECRSYGLMAERLSRVARFTGAGGSLAHAKTQN